MKAQKNTYAVILAGGMGTRFWPVSRKSNPKQFLNITGKGTLLQETLSRIKLLVKASHIYIVTNKAYAEQIEQQILKFKVPKTNILLEPVGKNTAPAICWAAAKIQKGNPDAVMVVLPSDHLILNQRGFLKVLGDAVRLAGEDYLVTLGIVPSRPETGYGYLKTAKVKRNGMAILRVEKFTEKPSLAKAKQFLKRTNYFWNSGMFVWKTSVILQEFKKYLPSVYRAIGHKTGFAHVRKVWSSCPNISIDYGILEKAKNVVAVPAPQIRWSDLGSWESLIDVLKKDKNGNIFKGKVVNSNSTNTFVWADKKIIAPVGLNNMIIIDTPDALLVCSKESSQVVKNIVSYLQKNKYSEI